jgi:ribosomal protein S18 acetylase RimI-like enzyme
MQAPNVRVLTPAEWPTYRDVRLRSLAESPDAFGRTLVEEQARSDRDWAERLRSGCESGTDLPLIAEAEGRCVGLSWGRFQDPANRRDAHLFQMWVDPGFRRRGIGRALLAAVIEWARQSGADYLNLGVTCDTAAMRLYERAGFAVAGQRSPIRPESALLGQAMRLPLVER